MKSQKIKGFTLIELLMVIAIIAILSSVVLASLSTARTKGRDARRLSDIRQIQNALELYRAANNSYPTSPCNCGLVSPGISWSNSNHVDSWTRLENLLSPYIPELPSDPKQSPTGWPGSGATYSYIYYSPTGSCYVLVYQLENASGPDPGANCNGWQQYGGTGADTAIKTVTTK